MFIERECYDILELMGDIGGITALIMGVLSIVTDYFASVRTDSIFAERAYFG
jgi:hypothetical protein